MKHSIKTIKQVQDEINELTAIASSLRQDQFENDYDKFKRAKDKHIKRILFLRTQLKYLETNPTPEAVANQIAKLESIMQGLESGYAKKLEELKKEKRNIDEAKLMSAFKKENDFAKMKMQCTSLKYLLEK